MNTTDKQLLDRCLLIEMLVRGRRAVLQKVKSVKTDSFKEEKPRTSFLEEYCTGENSHEASFRLIQGSSKPLGWRCGLEVANEEAVRVSSVDSG